jgi:hypothetical protein
MIKRILIACALAALTVTGGAVAFTQSCESASCPSCCQQTNGCGQWQSYCDKCKK